MNYQEANQQLTGRCRDSKKLCNNTYLQRRGEDIAVLLHSTDVITFHPNGVITLDGSAQYQNSVTTKDRINSFQNVARMWSEREVAFLTVAGKRYPFHNGITIRANGTVVGYDSDKVREEALEEIFSQWREADRKRGRQLYWIRKARGVGKRDNSACTRKGSWCRCHHPRRGAMLGTCTDCGCTVSRVAIKTRLTVEEIMNESNVTVRMAQAHCYGLERFLLDAKARTIDTHGEYALLSLPMGTWQSITALKMTCPSTGAVYISPVEPSCRSVSQALDWYFDTPNYLETLQAES